MKKMGPHKFMHTIDGKPACWYEGEHQIVFAVRCFPIVLCKSLREIGRQQRATDKYRSALQYEPVGARFGWLRVTSVSKPSDD